jgi:hypothetical protein
MQPVNCLLPSRRCCQTLLQSMVSLAHKAEADFALIILLPPLAASQVQTYALQAYSPASYNGESTELLTKWLGYIPAERVNDLAQYIKTPSSPLYSQGGIPGQLALQIDSSYPLVGSTSSGGNDSETSATTASKSDNTRRDTIIGVCVGVGGALWLALAVWIYRRVKRNHDAKIHRRLSERFSVGDTAGFAGGFSGNSRHSRTSSLAASEVDDRPSSFYANDADNFPAARSGSRKRHLWVWSTCGRPISTRAKRHRVFMVPFEWQSIRSSHIPRFWCTQSHRFTANVTEPLRRHCPSLLPREWPGPSIRCLAPLDKWSTSRQEADRGPDTSVEFAGVHWVSVERW